MSYEAIVLFLNHIDDSVSRDHLDLIRSLNPYPVIPIHVQPADPVPGSLDVGGDPQFECERGEGWAFCDNPLYQWYRRFGGCSKRYIFLEADTFASMPLREFYGDLWDAEVAVSTWATRESCPSWHWFRTGPYSLPTWLEPYAAGVMPMCGVLFSDDAIRTVAHSPAMPSRVISELRLGTLLRYHGIPVSPFPDAKRHTVNCVPITPDQSVPGVYHSVKAR